jgi:hypothetical protein
MTGQASPVQKQDDWGRPRRREETGTTSEVDSTTATSHFSRDGRHGHSRNGCAGAVSVRAFGAMHPNVVATQE